MMLFLELYLSFFKIGILSFGSGYGALPLIQQEIIEGRGWMTSKEFIDVLTMSEMTPGSLSINAATFVGNHLSGIAGGLVATLGVLTPAVLTILALTMLYYKFRNLRIVQGIIEGLRPAVVALIAMGGLTILLTSLFGTNEGPFLAKNINYLSIVLIGAALWLFHKTRLGPIKVMLLSGIVGLIVFSF